MNHKKLTTLIVVTQSILVIWSIGSSLLTAGPIAASIITYGLFGFYVAFTIYTKDPIMIRLVTLGTVAGILELFTDNYLVEGIHNLVYPANEAMIWTSPAYMPFAWANVLIQLGYYGILLSKWKGWMLSSVILLVAGGMYIPLYEHLAKDAGWWYYHQKVPMIFNAPVYVILCEGLISLSLPLLLTRPSNKGVLGGLLYGAVCGIWIYISAVLAYWISG